MRFGELENKIFEYDSGYDSLTLEDHIDYMYITLKINRGIGIIRRVRQLILENALLLLY